MGRSNHRIDSSGIYHRVSNKREYRLFLSYNDDYVPDDYLSITEIFTNPKCALPGFAADEWCIGKTRLKQMREKTYNEVLKRFRITKAERYDKFWNGNIDAINQVGINEFAKLPFFVELASVMVAFEERIDTTRTSVASKRKYISFGIRKSLYRKYYDHLKAAIDAGEEAKPIKLYEPKKRKLSDVFCTTQQTTIVFDGPQGGKPHYVEINKNELFLAYERWCKIKGISKKQGLYEAMRFIMEKYPEEETQDIEKFRTYSRSVNSKNDILAQEIVLSPDENSKPSYVSSYVPAHIQAHMKNIITAYNSDVQNAGKQRLTQKSFILQAIIYYIKHLPLKYTDPQAYAEYKAIKEAEDYNNSI